MRIFDRIEQAPLNASEQAALRQALHAGDYASAESQLVAKIDAGPNSPDLLTLAGGIFLLDHNPVNAAIALKKAAKIRPLTVTERFTLAMAYLGMHKNQWSRRELDALAREVPTNPIYRYWLARLDYDDRNYLAAIERLRLVTKERSDFLKAWDNLGLSLEGAGRLDEAEASYREAVRLNQRQTQPSEWPPLNLGILLTRAGKLKEGEDRLREAISYSPKSAKAHYRLGANLHAQKREEEATAELRESVSLDSTDPGPVYLLARIYKSRGENDAAATAFSRFQELTKKQRAQSNISLR
jgi:tetratricopeptide (TPR) repeat protein